MQKISSQYHLIRKLAKKYSHSTYLASPTNPQRGDGEPEDQVVLTVYASSLFRFPREREIFLQKAQCIKDLEHLHLVPILDMGIIEEEQPFIAWKYLPKGSLRSRLRKMSPDCLDLREALTIVSQIGQALVYAHEHNIVHGNLKPENILFDTNDQAVLTDFSLVERNDAILRDQNTQEYAFCYFAPEQFAGTCDARSDQYALGCLTYELIAGRVPFVTQSLASMMGQSSYSVPAPLSQHVANLPSSLEVAVLKTLARDPEGRFFDFSLFLEVIGSSLSPTPAFPLLRSTSSRKKKRLSHPVPSTQAGMVSSPIRERAVRRAAPELPEPSGTSSGARGDIREPAGPHGFTNVSVPEQAGTHSLAESFASVHQSQLVTSSLSQDGELLDNREDTSPPDPFQEQKDEPSSTLISEGMSLAGSLPAESVMATQMSKEELDDVLLVDPFVEQEADILPVIVPISVHKGSRSETSKITSLVERTPDVPRPWTLHISRSRLVWLVLLLSISVALLTYTSEPFISTFWPSEQVKLRGHSYPAGTPVNNLTDHTKFLQIPAQTSTVTATATTTFESSPTATVRSKPVSNASAPSTTTSGTTNSDPYSPSGTLALNDPLRDNSRGYGWQTSPPASSNGGSSCQFTGGAYYAYSQDNIYNTCRPSLNASNFTFEVQMQIISGNCGGLTLRDDNKGNAYSYQVCQDGSYTLDRFASSIQTLTSGSSAAITRGLNQSNIIAAVANGSTFDLYVNHQKIASTNDSSLSGGSLGVTAGNSQVAYTNARIWTL